MSEYTISIGPGGMLVAGMAAGALYSIVHNIQVSSRLEAERIEMNGYIYSNIYGLQLSTTLNNINEQSINSTIPVDSRILFIYVHAYVLQVLREVRMAYIEERSAVPSRGHSDLLTPSFAQLMLYESLLREHYRPTNRSSRSLRRPHNSRSLPPPPNSTRRRHHNLGAPQ